jgi:hypothetical protein
MIRQKIDPIAGKKAKIAKIAKSKKSKIQNLLKSLTRSRPQRVNDDSSRFARFILVQHTKTGKNLPNGHKTYQLIVKYYKRTQ